MGLAGENKAQDKRVEQAFQACGQAQKNGGFQPLKSKRAASYVSSLGSCGTGTLAGAKRPS